MHVRCIRFETDMHMQLQEVHIPVRHVKPNKSTSFGQKSIRHVIALFYI